MEVLCAGWGGVVVLIVIALVAGALNGDDDVAAPSAAPTDGVVGPSDALSGELVATTEPSVPAEAEILTVENNSELAALLVGPDQGTSVEVFAAKNTGQLIGFDGSIAALAPHGETATRFDILVVNGDYSETMSGGDPHSSSATSTS